MTFKLVTLSLVIFLPLAGFSTTPEKKVKKIHNKALTVDTHCDTPMALLNQNFDIGAENKAPQSRVDFPRMKKGGLDAIFFAAFTSQRERTPENTESAYMRANEMIDASYAVCSKYNNLAEVALNSGDAKRIEKSGKRAIYIGMENGFPIGKDLKRVEEFYKKGVRYITLCHSKNNDICDSSTDNSGPEHNGLSDFGEKVVSEMNRLGILIDVSHLSDESFFDIIEISKTPIFASHSSVRAIAHHPRNLTDDMIKALAKNGGVIQICLLDNYIKDADTTTVRYQEEKEIRKIFATTWETLSEEEKNEVRAEWRGLDQKNPEKLPTVAHYVDHIN